MSKSKHTPGPWMTDERQACTAIMAGASTITFIYRHVELQGKPCGSITSQDKTPEELVANAHLIAAAPELLEALVRVVAEHDRDIVTEKAIIAARSAIRSALGSDDVDFATVAKSPALSCVYCGCSKWWGGIDEDPEPRCDKCGTRQSASRAAIAKATGGRSMNETRTYPQSCTSAFCGKSGMDCNSTCPHYDAKVDFVCWQVRTHAVQPDWIWSPSVWQATKPDWRTQEALNGRR